MEPHFFNGITGEEIPYSAAPTELLVAVGFMMGANPNELEHHDVDFRKRYAAILLRERGL